MDWKHWLNNQFASHETENSTILTQTRESREKAEAEGE